MSDHTIVVVPRQKIRDTKEKFHAKMGTIKERSEIDFTVAGRVVKLAYQI